MKYSWKSSKATKGDFLLVNNSSSTIKAYVRHWNGKWVGYIKIGTKRTPLIKCNDSHTAKVAMELLI